MSEIYRATAKLREQLTADQLLLITQWVDFYSKVPEPVLKKLKQEVKMDMIETTISEHIFNQGQAQGQAKGLAKGILEGQLTLLENLYQQGILSEAQMKPLAIPLRQKLEDLRE